MTGWLLRILVMVIGRSLRWRIEDPAGFTDNVPDQPVIFAAWHNRLFLVPYLFHRFWPGRRVAVMVSASRDGEKLARVLRRFDLICVRGSSSRRGKEALRELARLVEEGYDAGITPDGPRGPKCLVQDGVIGLAQLTGAPIIPVSYVVSRKITFKKAWDNFMIPLPFARVSLRIAPPLVVSRDAGESEREHKRLELEAALLQISQG
jgi:lysophospholipid acyltransferase (LPLAT)-like uncharacterized protein